MFTDNCPLMVYSKEGNNIASSVNLKLFAHKQNKTGHACWHWWVNSIQKCIFPRQICRLTWLRDIIQINEFHCYFQTKRNPYISAQILPIKSTTNINNIYIILYIHSSFFSIYLVYFFKNSILIFKTTRVLKQYSYFLYFLKHPYLTQPKNNWHMLK